MGRKHGGAENSGARPFRDPPLPATVRRPPGRRALPPRSAKEAAPDHRRIDRRRSALRKTNRHVYVRVRFEEQELRQQVKAAGGRWVKEAKLWQLPHNKAVRLGLKNRILER